MDEPKILVAIRKRPLSKKQQQRGDTNILSVKNRETVIVSEYKQKVDLTKYLEETIFNFDFAFDEDSNNQDIYYAAVRPLVDSAFQGAKVTCFAYGQTGSGKTFTMNGHQKTGVVGLYALAAQDIFGNLADPHFQHLVAKLSYYEIYCGKLYDLLNKRQQLKIREDNKSNINIIGLEEAEVYSWNQFLDFLKIGASQRITSQNSANSESSRSHAILQVTLKDGKKISGKLSFIDLAGNQRGADHTDQKKQTRIDGAQINKSLLSLKECIRALDQGKSHTPFRGSKLTMVLKDSFIGFCRTLMIGNVSPSSGSSQNTMNTLRYADRVKQLKKPNEAVSKEQQKARELMLPRHNKNAIKIQINHDDDADDIALKRIQAQKQLGVRNEEPQLIYANINSTSNQHKNINEQFKQPNRSTRMSKGKKYYNEEIKQPIVSNNLTKVNMINNRKGSMGTSGMFNQANKGSPDIMNRKYSGQINKGLNNARNNYKQMDIEQNKNKFFQNNQQNLTQVNNFVESNIKQTMRGSQVLTYKNDQNKYNSLNSNLSPTNPRYRGQINENNSGLGNSIKLKNEPPNNFNVLLQNLQQAPQINTHQHKQYIHNASQQIHKILFNQENYLLQSHSGILRSELDVIKNQMAMIQGIQQDRNQMSTRQYLNNLQQSIDDKMSSLQMLRQKMLQFRYKFDAVEQFQNQRDSHEQMDIQVNQGNNIGDDEQLLDDLH